MQIWAESGKSALPICNYSQILYQFLTFTQNLKRSLLVFHYETTPFRKFFPAVVKPPPGETHIKALEPLTGPQLQVTSENPRRS